MQNSVAKKIFAVGSAVVMTLAMVAPFVAQAAVHAAGTNVSDSTGTVWMVMPDGTRRAYTSAGAFLSYGFNSWSQVVPASAEDLALPQGSFIPPQDGSIICSDRGADAGTCYEISSSQKFGFTSAAVFTGLGFSFTNSMPGDVSWMTMSPTLLNNTTMAHLPGTLVNNVGTVQLMGTTGLLGIPDVATFNSWGYSFGKVAMANAADKAMTQTGVMATRVAGQLSPTALASTGTGTGTGTGTVVNGTVTASLASDTPAAGTLVSTPAVTGGGQQTPGQTGADLAHFTFSGSGTVTQVVINRIGVSADTSVNNVYLYQGNNRITDAGSLSNGRATFSNSNGLFTVSGSVEISVRVDVAGGISGQTIGMQLASFTVANGSPMTTSVSGNLFQVAQVNNLATVALTCSNTTNCITGSGASAGTAGQIQAGTTNAVLWSAPITVGQRAVQMKYIAFKQIGSVSASALQNLKLFVDGTAVGSVASISSNGSNTNVVVFDLTGSPISLSTGGHTLELHGDIIAGSSYNYNFTLQQAADVVFYDTNYSVNVPMTYTGGASIFQLSPGTTTVQAGVISVQQDPTFTATQFVANQSQVVLGSWTMKAYGEDVKVQNLQVQLSYAGGTPATAPAEGFNNVSLYVNNGMVGSSQNAVGASASTAINFGSSNLFTVPAGTTVTVQVKGDSVVNNTVTPDFNTVTTNLITPASSLQGVTSFTLSPATSTTYTGRGLSVGGSVATLAKNVSYNVSNLTANTAAQQIGSYIIQAGTIDGVRVSSLTVGLSGTLPLTSLSNLYLLLPDGTKTTPVSPQSSNNFSLSFTVPANGTATVGVFADVGSLPTGNLNNGNAPTLTAATIINNGNTTDQLSTLTVGSGTSAIAAGNVFGVTYTQTDQSNATTVSYTALSSDTLSTVATQLASLLTGSSAVASTTVTTNANVVILTGKATTTVFTLTNMTATQGTQTAGNTASITTSMFGVGTGVTSNQSVAMNNGATPPGPIAGQTITAGTGSLTAGSLSSAASPVSAYVAGGIASQPIATYNFVTSNTGSVNITELGFVVPATGAISSVTVGGQPGSVVGNHVLVTGLNINVPVGNAGLNVPVTAVYSTAGTNGVSDQTVFLTLAHVKYIAGSTTISNGPSSLPFAGDVSNPALFASQAGGLASPTMELVGSYPTMSVTSTSNGGLSLNEQHLMDVTVTPNAAGNVQINTLVFSVQGSGLGSATLASERLAIGSTNVTGVNCLIGGSAAAQNIQAATNVICTFPGSYSVAPSSPITFSLYGTVGGTLGSGGTSSVSTSLAPSSNFSWTDITGSGTVFTTQNTTYFVNYPSQSWSVHN